MFFKTAPVSAETPCRSRPRFLCKQALAGALILFITFDFSGKSLSQDQRRDQGRTIVDFISTIISHGSESQRVMSMWRAPPKVWLPPQSSDTYLQHTLDERIIFLRDISIRSGIRIDYATSEADATALLVLDVDPSPIDVYLKNPDLLKGEASSDYLPQSLAHAIDFVAREKTPGAVVEYSLLSWGVAIYLSQDGAIYRAATWLHFSELSMMQLPGFTLPDEMYLRRYIAPRKYRHDASLFQIESDDFKSRIAAGTPAGQATQSLLFYRLLSQRFSLIDQYGPIGSTYIRYRSMLLQRGLLAVLGIRGIRSAEGLLSSTQKQSDSIDAFEAHLFRQAVLDRCWVGHFAAILSGVELLRFQRHLRSGILIDDQLQRSIEQFMPSSAEISKLAAHTYGVDPDKVDLLGCGA